MSTTVSRTELTTEDFLQRLLQEQSDLSAVERFSVEHEALLESDQPAQAKYYQSLLPAEPPTPDQQYAFQVDLDACSGCKACVVACHTLNGLEEEESWRRVGMLTSDQGLPQIKHVTTACHHCEDPGCLNGCPVIAYEKDPETGIVRHLDDQCMGCKYCTMMCPYEVPKYSSRLGIVRKCDMCHQRLSQGEAPACVQSCPNEAISIRLVPRAQSHQDHDRLVPSAPFSSITRPTTQYVSQHSIEDVPTVAQDNEIDHLEESHWPLAVMLVLTQASVGTIFAERLWATYQLLAGQTHSQVHTLTSTAAAMVLAMVGLGVAPLHLGQPLRAWRVFLGLKTSWLSREAVLLGKYVGALVAAGLLLGAMRWMPDAAWLRSIPTWTGKLLLGVSLLLGIAGLVSSGMIYIATRRELWNHRRTLVRFLGSGLIVGSLFAAAITGSAPLAIGSALLLSLKLGYEWLDLLGPSRSSDSQFTRRSRRLIDHALTRQRRGRIASGVATIAFTTAGAWLMAGPAPVLGVVLTVVAASLALAGELLERLIYFSSVVFVRMPGALP